MSAYCPRFAPSIKQLRGLVPTVPALGRLALATPLGTGAGTSLAPDASAAQPTSSGPASDTVTAVPNLLSQMFCPDHLMLDQRLLDQTSVRWLDQLSVQIPAHSRA